ncbi:HPr-rel-A system PqqD family peptide chaperone [Noviherbaspirillum cavernae]|nr:HPr-rel-A system PqqD family peptide chaperone [Noviherbaspirillum cavernae]
MWQVAPGQPFSLRVLGDEFVAYHPLSGDTHLLGAAAGHILVALQQSPSDTAALAERLASLWQTELHHELALETEGILADLESLALIERVPS